MSRRIQHLGMAIALALVLVGGAWLFRSTSTGSATAPSPITPSATAESTSSPSASAPSSSPSSSPSATPVASPTGPHGPGSTVAFIGDSLTAGNGASTPAKRWTTVLAVDHQWREVNVGHPQSGYVVGGSSGDCTLATCPPFPDVVGQVVPANPALVIIAGGSNDLGQDLGTVGQSVTRTVTSLREALPQATVVVLAPWWDMRPEQPGFAELSTTIKDAATAAGATWIDTGQPLKGHGELFGQDGYSPNDEGHATLARAVGAGLIQAGVTTS